MGCSASINLRSKKVQDISDSFGGGIFALDPESPPCKAPVACSSKSPTGRGIALSSLIGFRRGSSKPLPDVPNEGNVADMSTVPSEGEASSSSNNVAEAAHGGCVSSEERPQSPLSQAGNTPTSERAGDHPEFFPHSEGDRGASAEGAVELSPKIIVNPVGASSSSGAVELSPKIIVNPVGASSSSGRFHMERGDSRSSTMQSNHSKKSNGSSAQDHSGALDKTILHSGSFVRRPLRVRALTPADTLKKALTMAPSADMAMPVFDAKMDPINLLEQLPANACKPDDLVLERVTFMGTEWLAIRCSHGDREQCLRFCICASALSNIGRSCSRSVVVEVVGDDASMIPAFACAPISSARRGTAVSISWLDHAEGIAELARIILNEEGKSQKVLQGMLKTWSQRDWTAQPSTYQLGARRPSVSSVGSGRSGRSSSRSRRQSNASDHGALSDTNSRASSPGRDLQQADPQSPRSSKQGWIRNMMKKMSFTTEEMSSRNSPDHLVVPPQALRRRRSAPDILRVHQERHEEDEEDRKARIWKRGGMGPSNQESPRLSGGGGSSGSGRQAPLIGESPRTRDRERPRRKSFSAAMLTMPIVPEESSAREVPRRGLSKS
eukprot:TRINITY_DN2568_c0_g1_i1.p1 TRINITY_DN2568_c0_g1~~TRINITY_DN2568_c0_g1_i1.p1  ORF type:complete len:610 (-),score=89.82 TRINITY_DN2568_c0_g1_i1:60-1889(-)